MFTCYDVHSLDAIDNTSYWPLCMTSAFDTIDHDLLMLQLQRQLGLHVAVLSWFRSYLSDRMFRVLYCGSTSPMVYIVCSVPQGSVLDPRLFILYTADLADVTEKHGVRLHAFVADTQLYLHCRRDDMAATAVRLERCIMEVGHWMSSNRLKLNADKTELLWAGLGVVVLLWVTAAPLYGSE